MTSTTDCAVRQSPLFADVGKAYEACRLRRKKFTEELTQKTAALTEEKQRYQELVQEEEVLKEEKESLTKSDAAS